MVYIAVVKVIVKVRKILLSSLREVFSTIKIKTV